MMSGKYSVYYFTYKQVNKSSEPTERPVVKELKAENISTKEGAIFFYDDNDDLIFSTTLSRVIEIERV